MNQETFAELLRSHQNRVFSYAFYFLRDREEAEDITQEVFLRLWRSCRAEDRRAREAWLVRTAHNLCIDVKRRRQTAQRHLARLDPAHLYNLPAGGEEALDPEAGLQIDQTQRILLDALQELPPPARSVILLHYFQGLSCRQIGQALQVKETTIKTRIHRGRRALRRILAERLDRPAPAPPARKAQP